MVGYQKSNSICGFNFLSPTFRTVGDDGVKLQAIKLVGDNVTEYADNLQILDEGGAINENYYWQECDGEYGWVIENGSELSDRVIDKGVCVNIYTENDDVEILFSGEVSSVGYSATSICGFNFVGNSNPTSIDIQDVKVLGDNVTEYADNLQILDEGGAILENYYWQEVDGTYGWVIENGDSLASREIPAGLGFIVYTENDDVEISIKGITL